MLFSVAKSGRMLLALLSLSQLSACTAIPVAMVEAMTEMALPGAVGATAGQLTSQEKSFSAGIEKTLAATQQVLHKLKLDVDLLEFQKKGGYALFFSGENVRGSMMLRRHTTGLTTANLKVRDITREKSVENAIFSMIEKRIEQIDNRTRFDRRGFNNIRSKPTVKSEKVGIYRRGGKLTVRQSVTPQWLQIDLPSGRNAYLKGKKEQFRNPLLD